MQIGGLGTNSTATLGGTSQIQKSAKKTVENAMTDRFVEQIKEMARKDAQTGVYMSDEFAQMRQAYKTRYVSPNRSGLQGQVMSFMQRAAMGGNRGNFLMRLLGGYSMKASLGIHSQYNTAEVFAPNGELVGAYTCGGQWVEFPTEAESQFLGDTNLVYLEAYRAARAEMKSAAQGQAPADTATVDIRA